MTEKGTLPESWTWCSLEDILETLESGGRPKGGVSQYSEGIPSIGGEHLNEEGGFSFEHIRFVPPVFYNKMNKGRIYEDDVLLVKDGATTGKVSLVNSSFPFKEAAVNEHVFILRSDKNLVVPGFLFQYLFSQYGQTLVRNKFQGSAQGGINSNFIVNFPFPLAPISEQKRISSSIDQVFRGIYSMKRAVERIPDLMRDFRKSLLKKAFLGELTIQDSDGDDATILLGQIGHYREEQAKGKMLHKKSQSNEFRRIDIARLATLPKGWVWTTLANVCDIEMGQSPEGSSYNKDGKGVPLLNGPTEFGMEYPKAVQWTTAPSKLCSKKDILICVRGNTTGKMNIADQEYCIGRGLAAIRPVNDFVNRQLVYYFLHYMTNEIMKRTAGSTFPNLAGEQLRAFPFALPPRNLQDILASKIKDAFVNSQLCEARVAKVALQISTLQRSVLGRAFRGELVRQDPNDEPATVLLQRIKTERGKGKELASRIIA